MTSAVSEARPVAIRLEQRDAHVWVTRASTAFAAFGLLFAGAMAVWGLPPVDFHGPLHHIGIMDPLCGGTRSAYLTAQGDLAGAWTYNPLGIITVLGAAAVLGRTALGAATGRWLNLDVRLTRGQRRALWAIVILGFVLLTIRQNAQAELLTAWGVRD